MLNFTEKSLTIQPRQILVDRTVDKGSKRPNLKIAKVADKNFHLFLFFLEGNLVDENSLHNGLKLRLNRNMPKMF